MSEPARHSTDDSEPTDEAFARLFDAFVDLVSEGNEQKIQDFLAAHRESQDRLRRLRPTVQVMANVVSEPERRDMGASRGGSSVFVEADHTDGSAALIAGTTLGDFRVVREIARGGMGIVYEAEQLSISRRVALKILPLAAVMDPRHVRRFKNEVQAAAMLQHQHIVPVYSVGFERGIHYYAMQYVEGHTLAEVITSLRETAGIQVVQADGLRSSLGRAIENPNTKNPKINDTLRRLMAQSPGSNNRSHEKSHSALPGSSSSRRTVAPVSAAPLALTTSSTRTRDRCRVAARLMIQAAEALDHAHERGVLHRDIKPGNLMIDITGDLWITDFGLARLEADPETTVTGQVLGTLRYMSPEQALAQRTVVDHRTDIYSLGATLYELCALQPAHPAENRSELLKQITQDQPRPLRKCDPAIPRELEIITSTAMEKDPADRYETARTMADDLRRFLDHRPIWARPPSLGERLWKWSMRRRRTVLAAASVAFLFLLLALAGMSFHSQQLRVANQTLEALNAELSRSHQETRELFYLADMRLAFKDWDDRRLDEVQRLLTRHQPRRGEADIRGSEWHLLAALANPPESITFSANDRPIREIARVPDREEFVSVGDQGTVRHWSISQKRLLRTIQTEAEQLHAVAISPDGKWMATGNPTLSLWDFATGEKIRDLATNQVTLESIAFAPDSNTIAAAWRYDTVCLVKRNGEVTARLPATGLRNETLAFSQDGNILFVPVQTGQGHVIRRWKVPSPDDWSDLGEASHDWSRIAVSHDDAVSAAVSNGGQVQIIQNATGQVVAQLGSSAEVIRALSFSSDSDRLAWGSDDGMFHVAIMRRGWQTEPTSTLPYVGLHAISAHHSKITDVECLAEDRFLTCGEDGNIRLWTLVESDVSLRMALPETADNSVAFAPDSTQFVIAGADGNIRLASAADGHVTNVFRIGNLSLREAVFHPDGWRIMMGSDCGRITAWDRIERHVVAEWQAPQPARIWALTVSPIGDFVASAAADQHLRIHDATSLSVIETFSTSANVKTLDFSPDGKILACGGDFHDLVLYDTRTWRVKHSISTRSDCCCIAFANRDGVLASGHSNGFIQIVDARRGSVLHRRSSGSRLRSLVWTNDDRLLLSTHDDGTLRVWHASTATELGVLCRVGIKFQSICLSPDGRRLATVFRQENGSQAILWKLDQAEQGSGTKSSQ